VTERQSEEKFVCTQCDPPRDMTAKVIAERDEELDLLRSGRSRRQGTWSVVMTCPKGHEVAFSGKWP
jgi:hypothetical protein